MPAKMRDPVDPGAVDVVPATAERFGDVTRLVGPGPNAKGACWCLAPRFANSEVPDGREQKMRELCEEEVPPGLVAYVDGEPAGWIGLGPKTGIPRLMRSRLIPHVDDDEGVWSILCLKVLSPYRRRGLAALLLNRTADYARDRGVRALEAYPIDPEGDRINVSFGHVGFTGMFADLGFERVAPTQMHAAQRVRWLMRLPLRPAAAGGSDRMPETT